MRLRSTHTFVNLAVSKETYEEIKQKLLAAGYNHAFNYNRDEEETIDMHGIGLIKEKEKEEYEPKVNHRQV